MLSVVGVDTGVTSFIWNGASIVNGVTVNVLETFPAVSVTLIVILL